MTGQINKFSSLFRKYRLRSEIQTLTEFADLLAEEGMVYETSLFTRWQTGNRTPRDRKVLLAIIKVFAKRGGIYSLQDANEILESVKQRDLSEEEIKKLGLDEIKKYNFESQRNLQYLEIIVSIFKINRLRGISNLSSVQKTLLFLYSFIFLWFLKINILKIYDKNEIDIFSNLFPLIALIGAINGLKIAKALGGWKNYLGRSIIFFSAGLIGLWFGQTVWSYYNIVAKVEIPYPSLADVGFVSIIPFYCLGCITLGLAGGFKFEIRSSKQILIMILTPICVFLFAYFFLLQKIVFDFRSATVYLDLTYAFGEMIPILLGIIILLNITKAKMKWKILFLLVSLVFQYITDTTFIYKINQGTYINAGIIDIMMATAFFLMALGIEKYNKYVLLNPKNLNNRNVDCKSINEKFIEADLVANIIRWKEISSLKNCLNLNNYRTHSS